MRKQVILQHAIRETFHREMSKCAANKSTWNLFEAYLDHEENRTRYFKLIELPNTLRLCEQLCHSVYTTPQLLHHLSILPLQREIYSTYYLLQSRQNILLLKDWILLKSQCEETILEQTIISLLHFVAMLPAGLPLSASTIAVVEDSFLYCGYESLYFKNISPISNSSICLQEPLITLLKEILLLTSKASISELIAASQLYSQTFKALASRIISNGTLSSSLIKSFLEDYNLQAKRKGDHKTEVNCMASTVVCDNYYLSGQSQFINERPQSKDIVAQTNIENYPQLTEQLLPKIQQNKYARICVGVVLLVLAAVVTGVIVFTITSRKSCGPGQYRDNTSKCLSCYQDCLRCLDSQVDSCTSCRGTMYLTIKFQNDYVGKCLKQCKGRIIRSNLCLYNSDQQSIS